LREARGLDLDERKSFCAEYEETKNEMKNERRKKERMKNEEHSMKIFELQ
jgi:hypothetical protein